MNAKCLLLLLSILLLYQCTGKEKEISYIYDDRTYTCYAVYGDESITCIPCSYLVSYEAYFDYRGKYYPKSTPSLYHLDSLNDASEKAERDSIYVGILQSQAFHNIIRYGDFLKSDSVLMVRWKQLQEQKPDSITAYFDSVKIATAHRIAKLL